MAPNWKYRDIIDAHFVALNKWDFDAHSSDYADDFVQRVLPQSLRAPPKDAATWKKDLTSGYIGQNYKEWNARVVNYYEDETSALAWCNEKGTLVDGKTYEMDYIIRYCFDPQTRKIKELVEYTDSDLQKRIWRNWLKRQETEKKKQGQSKL